MPGLNLQPRGVNRTLAHIVHMNITFQGPAGDVLRKLARARGGVRPHWGLTVRPHWGLTARA